MTGRVSAEHRLTIVGKEDMSCRHVAPIEVVAGIEVPQRSEGPEGIVAFVFMNIDASRRRNLHIIYILLYQKVVDHRLHVNNLLQRLIVVAMDNCLKVTQCLLCITDECLWCGIVLGFRTLHAYWHTIHLRPEIVAGGWSLLRSVIYIERQQPAFLAVDIHTALALLYLFCQLIQSDIITVQCHLNIACMIRVRHAETIAHLKHKGIHQVRRITIIGQQHPVLLLL